MQKAKQTVEQDYAVVGTWEDTNITLSVLEHYIPRYFKNAKVAYYCKHFRSLRTMKTFTNAPHMCIYLFAVAKERYSQVNKNKDKRPVSDLTREILRKNLTNEIEFYEFCKQRLYMQYAAINDGFKVDNDDYMLIPDHEDDNDDDKEY